MLEQSDKQGGIRQFWSGMPDIQTDRGQHPYRSLP
jgi:hypothetical protein